jgi:hypothetical protein
MFYAGVSWGMQRENKLWARLEGWTQPRENADGRGGARVLCGWRRCLGPPLTRLIQ